MISQGEAQLLEKLGQISGELSGLRALVQAGTDATNRRIDDLRESVDQRLEGVTVRVETLEAGHKMMLTKTASLGGVAGGLVTGIIELIKWKAGA